MAVAGATGTIYAADVDPALAASASRGSIARRNAGSPIACCTMRHAADAASTPTRARPAAARGDVDALEVAKLDDRIRVFEGRPQRYGTQYDWSADGDALELMIGVEEPDTVDARRAAVGLPPLVWRRPPPTDERPPADRAARARAADAWARAVGWR